VVEPGIVLDVLNRRLAPHGLAFGPEPATHYNCTIGGMIGNNSCGATAQRTGKVVDNVERLDVLLHDGTRFWCGRTSEKDYARIVRGGGRRGEVYRQLRALRDDHLGRIRTGFPRIPRRVSGYNLDSLLPENGFDVAAALVGSESTLVTVLRAELRLVPVVTHHTLVVLGYPSIDQAADAVPAVVEHGPIALEGMDDKLIGFQRLKHMNAEALRLLPEGGGWLLVQFGGTTKEEADRRARALVDAADGEGPTAAVLHDPDRQNELWTVRESGLGATAHVPGQPETFPGWEDSAVAPDCLGDYLRDLHALYREFGYETASVYGHFGQGCVHSRIPFDLYDAEGVSAYRRFLERAAELVTRHGGSLSGEHGDGQQRGELLTTMFGNELVGAFRRFKAVFDPDGLMNPGKVVDPAPLDENLRLGASWEPTPSHGLHFAFPHDEGSFVKAANRCVGVGKCRRHDHSGATVMCPSYQVTREEEHSTRGRARLLFEMLDGHRDGPLTDGWRSDAVLEALDLCLACKGCKADCPGGRHGDLQGRVPVPLLEGQAAPAGGLCHGVSARDGASRGPAAAGAGAQRADPGPGPGPSGHYGRRGGSAARGAAVRRDDAPAVVRDPRARGRRQARRGAAVAGHLHQPLPPARRPGRGRGARGRRVAGADPAARAVLRPDLDLHRAARRRPRGAAPDRRRHGQARTRRWPGGRAGAQLYRGLPIRPGRTDARRPRRPAAARPHRHARRAAARAHGRLVATAPGAAGARAGPLPPPRRHALRDGSRAAARHGRRGGAAGIRLLRARRQLRVPARALRGQPGLC
jgi:FAD/FMN-containing dehydrogenase